MPETPLEHCKSVVIWQGPAPQDVDVSFAVGGPPGSGHVEVSGAPGEMDAPLCIPTGSFGNVRLPQVSMVSVHYYASEEGGLPVVPATLDCVPLPI
jgi:hypothetical protein